jgi:hypothetical protein
MTNSNNPGPAPTGTTPSPTPTPTPVPMTGNQTWNDGQQISGAITIMPGASVTVAPGAKITAASGTSITVQGTLTASSQTTHASITGTSWSGIIVASGGTMQLVGVDLAGAGIDVKGGATAASYDYGAISGASSPFAVEAMGKLETSHSTVSAMGASSVAGELDAAYLDYNTNGSEGIYSQNAAAILKIDNSRLYGTGTSSGDFISISGASLVHLAHTEIHGVHCAFHFNAVDTIDVSYMDIHDNSYGFMLYGSSNTGTRSITYSNIYNNIAYGADEGSANTVNGLITISDGYWSGNGPAPGAPANNLRTFTNAITVTNMSTTTKVGTAGPQ